MTFTSNDTSVNRSSVKYETMITFDSDEIKKQRAEIYVKFTENTTN